MNEKFMIPKVVDIWLAPYWMDEQYEVLFIRYDEDEACRYVGEIEMPDSETYMIYTRSNDNGKYAAVENGGNKLDSYAGNHGFYIKNGFEPVSWCAWVDDYAPDDWREGFQREPIVFYRYTGIKNQPSIEEFLIKTKASEDYDTAMLLRDKRIKNDK